MRERTGIVYGNAWLGLEDKNAVCKEFPVRVLNMNVECFTLAIREKSSVCANLQGGEISSLFPMVETDFCMCAEFVANSR